MLENTRERSELGRMAKITMLHNPNCSKSREAALLLEPLGARLRDISQNPLSEKEVLELIARLEGDVSELVRSNDEAFLAHPFDLKNSAVIARELAKNPALMERPVVVVRDFAFVARPLSRLEEWLNG
jgi:arsenate reductase